MDDSQFLGSIIGLPAPEPPRSHREAPAPPLPLPGPPKRRGRPPKRKDGPPPAPLAAAPPKPPPPSRRKEDEEEVVCFICFDGGDLVVCDRRSAPRRALPYLTCFCAPWGEFSVRLTRPASLCLLLPLTRGCPKVYHPACIKRDEAFFQSRSKWNCGELHPSIHPSIGLLA
jgi:hypothetical protein